MSDTEYTDSDGTKMVYWEWEEDDESYQGYFKIEPIKWRVLSVNGDDAFLLADKNLDAQPYNEKWASVTWETCTIRTWLNTTFLSTAFTSAEQAAIKSTTVVNDGNPDDGTKGGNDTTDKVYLLSIAEASNTAYGVNGEFQTESETRVATDTAYTASHLGMNSVGNADWWWVRSPGGLDYGVAGVSYDGYGDASGSSVSNDILAVRPTLHLNLSSSTFWRYAGKATSNGGGGEIDFEVCEE